MHKRFVLPALALPAVALLVLPMLAGCQKVEARMVLREANNQYAQDQYIAALKKYQQGLKLDPDATFAWRSVGLTALALYRPGDDSPKNIEYGRIATDAFQRYLADFPEDAKVQDYLMSTLVNAKQYDKALEYVEKQKQLHPGDARYDKYRLNVLIQAGRLDEAAQLAQRLPGPDQVTMLYSIGTSAWGKVYNNATIDAAAKQKYVDMGLQAIKRALEIKPDYFEAMVYYGLLYREKGKLETDGNKRLEDIDIATQWQNKAMELRKKSQPAAATAAGAAKTS
jgi:tetratricopeptide (TPR) repeat protein